MSCLLDEHFLQILPSLCFAVQLAFKMGHVTAKKYVAINFKCCHSSSAVSGMAEDTVHTNSWVLKQANALEKLPFCRVKIFICCAILLNTK